MKIFLSLLVFVSSCGSFVKDQATAGAANVLIVDFRDEYLPSENLEAMMMAYNMYFSGRTCDDIQDFLIDTSLDHNISLFCPTDYSFPNGPWNLTYEF